MWPFAKSKTLDESGLFIGFTDFHSHILPGVDDGVRTMEEALEILRTYEWFGIASVWLTPHIMEDMPNTTGKLCKCFEELKSAYTGSVALHLAAEYMLDNFFDERLAAGDLLPLGNQSVHLLVETSFFTPPMAMYRTLEQIRSNSYYPVLAHPERYLYMGEKEYRELKEDGVQFQLNLPSLAGAYGTDIRRKAIFLLNEGFYDMVGTDLHNS